jgi:hypothetical protein
VEPLYFSSGIPEGCLLAMLFRILALLAILGLARAAAATKRRAIMTLSSAEIELFKPYTLYAAAAYRQPTLTLSWSCGGRCGRSIRLSGRLYLHNRSREVHG